MKKPGKNPGGRKNLRPPFEAGNPGGPGRPKGMRNFKSYLKDFLRSQNSQHKKPNMQLMAENSATRAINGSVRHLEIILDRLYNKAIQPVKQDLEGYTEEDLKKIAEIELARSRRKKD